MIKSLKHMLILVLLILSTSCVERFYPGEDDLKTGRLVINAHLTNHPGIQIIEISRSVGLSNSSLNPESGSYVVLLREDGVLKEFTENRSGFYEADLDESFLQTGMSYMVQVSTSEGNHYESSLDKLRPVPAIDSIYYQVESRSYASESDSIGGIRFYIDFTYDDAAYEYLRWDVTETYEFHNPEMRGYFLNEELKVVELPDTSNYRICYISNELSSIHSMATSYLDFGIYIKKPFDFIQNIQIEQKLHHKYSLLVKQYSLGKEAYHYWNELKKTSQEQGWLFDKQPALLKSNIRNVNQEDEIVLGYFSMAGMVEKRAFAIEPEGLDLSAYRWYCFPISRGPGGPVTREDIPKYYAMALLGRKASFAEVNKHCVDCRAYRNSTHIKPDFW